MQFHRVACFTHRVAQEEKKTEEITKKVQNKEIIWSTFSGVLHSLIIPIFPPRFSFDISCGNENSLVASSKKPFPPTFCNIYTFYMMDGRNSENFFQHHFSYTHLFARMA